MYLVDFLKRSIRAKLMRRWQIPFSPAPHISPSVYEFLQRRTNLTVIDVGAHSGQFTAALARSLKVSSALLVEPLPSMVLAMQGDPSLARFWIEQCAAGASSGRSVFNHFPRAPYISSLHVLDTSIPGLVEVAKGRSEEIDVPIRTIDELLTGKPEYNSVDIMKIDVQGGELDVLRGAQSTLDRTTAIFCEISFRPVYKSSCTFFDVYDHLVARGFMLSELEPGYRAKNGELLQGDAFFLRSP